MSEEINEPDDFLKFMEEQSKKDIRKLTYILSDQELENFYEVVTLGAHAPEAIKVAVKLSDPE